MKSEDVRIYYFRRPDEGVNVSPSCVRVVHIETGIVVEKTDGTRRENRARAMGEMRCLVDSVLDYTGIEPKIDVETVLTVHGMCPWEIRVNNILGRVTVRPVDDLTRMATPGISMSIDDWYAICKRSVQEAGIFRVAIKQKKEAKGDKSGE